MQVKIIINRIKCKFCGDILESKSRHDFKFCSCGKVAIDGGHFYLKRSGKPVIESSRAIIGKVNILFSST